jgi:fermentation-respiration switch protein FrsA (DUF1100 family)
MGMKRFMKIILLLLILAVGLKIWISFLERKITFYPNKKYDFLPDQLGLQHQEVKIETEDGENLAGWFFYKPENDYTVLFFHGNAENVSHRLDFAERIVERQFNLLLVDYRGYGKSSGSPSEKGLYRDALASFKYLTDSLKVAPEKVVVWGISIGGAAAADLASQVDARALILEGAFTSAKDMSKQILPPFPWHWLASYKFDNLGKISRVRMPVLFIHGDRDETIPYWMGKKLFETANQPKFFYTVPGAGHNDTFDLGGEEYFHQIESFIRKH